MSDFLTQFLTQNTQITQITQRDAPYMDGFALLSRFSPRGDRSVRCGLALPFLFLFFTNAMGAEVQQQAIRFDRDIRAILADNCFSCHGRSKQEAGLRLDLAAGATQKLESQTRAIVVGNAAASELMVRLNSTDPEVVMPPPHAKK